MPFERDPASVYWDNAAARFLAAVLSVPRGQWWGTRAADPLPRHTAAMAARGIRLLGPDRPSAVGGRRGGLDARDRWRRAFARAVYHLAAGSVAVELQVGRKYPPRGVIPGGRYVRGRVRPAGPAAMNAARRKPQGARIYEDDNGAPGLRWSDPTLRDW